jgi:hypothetical protein
METTKYFIKSSRFLDQHTNQELSEHKSGIMKTALLGVGNSINML